MTKCVSMLLFAMATPLACQAFVAPGSSLSVSALGREGVSRSSSKVGRIGQTLNACLFARDISTIHVRVTIGLETSAAWYDRRATVRAGS